MKKAIFPIFGVLVFFIFFSFATKQQSKAEELPVMTRDSKLHEDLKLEFHVERGGSGAIFIVGQTNLPDGMKLGADIYKNKEIIGQDFEIMVKDGKFRSAGFTLGNRPHRPGPYKVEVLSYFNPIWQNESVLKVLKNLRSSKIFKVHPDVVDSMLKLSDTRVLPFPTMQMEVSKAPEKAISLVQNAVLSDPERGVSSKNVLQRIEDILANSDLIRPRNGWSARQQAGDIYEVEFDYMDTNKPYQAIWNVNIKTRNVKYINMSAKVFSFAP